MLCRMWKPAWDLANRIKPQSLFRTKVLKTATANARTMLLLKAKNRKPRSHGGFLFWVFVAFGSQTDGKRRLTSVAMPSEAFWLMTSMW